MKQRENIGIEITLEILAEIKAAVDDREYIAAGKVVQEALQDWGDKHRSRTWGIERISKLWAEGIESGPPMLADFEAIKAEARRHWEIANR